MLTKAKCIIQSYNMDNQDFEIKIQNISNPLTFNYVLDTQRIVSLRLFFSEPKPMLSLRNKNIIPE